MQLPPGESQPGRPPPSSRPTGTPSTRRSGRTPKFASRSTPTTAPPSATRLAVPIPPFHSKQTMPVPAPTAPWADIGRGRGAGQRAAGVGRLDLHHAGVVEPAVVALRHHRDRHVLDAHAGLGIDGRRHGAVVHAPHGHRGGEVHGGVEHPPLADVDRARHLTGAVEHGHAGADRVCPQVVRVARENRRDPAAGDAAAGGRIGLVAHRRSRGRPARRPRPRSCRWARARARLSGGRARAG